MPQHQLTGVRLASFADLDGRTLHDLLKLRVDVFVVEQECPYPEIDGRDVEPDTRHLWVAEDDTPVACLRLLVDPDGVRRIGRVAVAKSARGRGYADRLMTEALRLVGAHPCVLDAQTYVVDFYQRHGFTVSGPEYLEDGIPHRPMRREAEESTSCATPGN
ncbi:GNAT family N-acetyltransferase [Micromonospora sonneratiae]|uniref:GNAT family N-acetyltransferase n=1 Tax=Micromonospora sonneratiae TaxID=1184706 RepID=A0ABW3YP31_9ACTN